MREGESGKAPWKEGPKSEQEQMDYSEQATNTLREDRDTARRLAESLQIEKRRRDQIYSRADKYANASRKEGAGFGVAGTTIVGGAGCFSVGYVVGGAAFITFLGTPAGIAVIVVAGAVATIALIGGIYYARQARLFRPVVPMPAQADDPHVLDRTQQQSSATS